MAARLQPTHQARLGTREVDIGHADLGESQRRGPAAQPRQQVIPVEHTALTALTAHQRHASILGSRDLVWASEADCAASARALAHHEALRNAFIELRGPLGAGKTTFVRHLLRALGVLGRVKSPSYAVVEPHEAATPSGALHIWHFDFFRFKDPNEWEDAGFRDLFAAEGLKLAEWPEKALGVLPRPDLRIDIAPLENDSRHARVCALTPRGLELLK